MIGSNGTVGSISLRDTNVFATFVDVEQYMPRVPPPRPNDVRFGSSWASGVPALNFTLVDATNDGVLDIVLRWARSALGLQAGEQDIQIWGLDRSTGRTYCGSTTVNVVP
ncbi:MAG: hypothetical protein EA350_00730 [Gemmatimonadales bacterium]|nr:MAG: hypothetical protein EA350_00730 [Gemmatimonadales bacterium]